MNQVIETILSHRSIRNYKSDEINPEQLDMILESCQSAPSSINGQHVSIIVVRDIEKKAILTNLCGNQPYISEAPVFLVFCIDFYRAKLAAEKNHMNFEIINHLESTLVGCVDVGLAMQNAITSAESIGLGTVPIGGIRNQPDEVIKQLNLPQYVFPICGLCVGYPSDPSAIKPRLPKVAVIHNEVYNSDQTENIDIYDEEMKNYMIKRSHGKSDRNWTQGIANFYKNSPSRNTLKEMEKQGFKNQ